MDVPAVPWITFVSASGDGKSLPLRLMEDIIIMLEKRAFAKQKADAENQRRENAQLSAADRDPAPPAKKPRRPGWTWEHGSLVGSAKRMSTNGGRALGVVHEGKQFFEYVMRQVPGYSVVFLNNLYDKGRINNVVTNESSEFTVDEPHFPLLIAAHLEDIMECLTCRDAAGVLSRFEFVYFEPKFQRMEGYGDLNKDACCKKVYNAMVQIEKLFPDSGQPPATSATYFPHVSKSFSLPAEDAPAFDQYFNAHVDLQRTAHEQGRSAEKRPPV